MQLSSLPLLAALAALTGLAAAKPEKIRGVRDPIYHLYLQSHPDDPSVVVLGPEATAEEFDIDGTIQAVESGLFLNVGDDSTSYKTLTFDDESETTAWGLEGDTISTMNGSEFGRQINFLVCKLDATYWQVYLQMGSETPSGMECSNYQTIHLPCLC